jgi:glycosyltransferase involved in cell wall biosynthesis
MKVLHVSASDRRGGAAIAAYRLHCALRREGVDSRMLVQDKGTDDPAVTGDETPLHKLLSRARPYAGKILKGLQDVPHTTMRSLNIIPTGRLKAINKSDADVVHLHWVNDEMLTIREISRIEKPTVWTLHDAWPFCGAEHYWELNNDKRYRDGYTTENYGEKYQGIDIDRWIWALKTRFWNNVPDAYIAPSRWMADKAREGKISRNTPIFVIPNAIDTNIYKPIDQSIARHSMNIPKDRPIIAFGAVKPTSNMTKGFDLLQAAMGKLHNHNATVLIFGASQGPGEDAFGLPTLYLGYLHDDVTRALVYAAADVVLVPSRIESFGLTAAEALSCGTPVVCFNTSGLKDVVVHEDTGYLAKSFSTEDLARGIKYVLNPERSSYLSQKARSQAIERFNYNKVASDHVETYERVIREA